MTLLIIDTSGEQAQVAVVRDTQIVSQHAWENTPQVGPALLEYIESAIQAAHTSWDEIHRIAVHRGPRPADRIFFSGLRTGITTAMMLASAKEKELVGISGDTIEELIAQAEKATPEAVILPKYE